MATRKKTTAKKATMPRVPATKDQELVPMDFGDDSLGDDINQSEAGIPFVKVLQAQSPEVHGKAKMTGARAGMILNGGTQELLEQLAFVPAVRTHQFVAWRKRADGGGMVAQYAPDDEVVRAAQDNQEFGKWTDADGNDLVETFYLFGIVCNSETWEPQGMAVIPFSSTAIKPYKKQLAQRMYYTVVSGPGGKMVKPPMYAHRILVDTAEQSNDKGTWFNYRVQFAVDNNVKASLMGSDHPAYQAAKGLRMAVMAGEAQADTSTLDREASAGEDDKPAF